LTVKKEMEIRRKQNQTNKSTLSEKGKELDRQRTVMQKASWNLFFGSPVAAEAIENRNERHCRLQCRGIGDMEVQETGHAQLRGN
jgi:hypothetical protein